MTLADAIRKGAMQREQATRGLFGRLSLVDGRVSGSGSCALGAAYEGTFGAPNLEQWNDKQEAAAYHELADAFPELSYRQAVCPAGGCDYRHRVVLENVVIHLNDSPAHQWTREQIADWLDTL